MLSGIDVYEKAEPDRDRRMTTNVVGKQTSLMDLTSLLTKRK